MKKLRATIITEFGPFLDTARVLGVTFDGAQVWCAAGDRLIAVDPLTGSILRTIDVPAHAGTAFDGKHLYQLAEDRIQKINPINGALLSSIPAPDGGECSGLAWSEGLLWVGSRRKKKISQVDPGTGQVLRTIESDRFVTGVTWVDSQLWHGTSGNDESSIRRIDPDTGEVIEQIDMPPGIHVSGLESDGGTRFFCGGGPSGKLRVVRRPRT